MSYLCTKVKTPTKNDKAKLERVMGYLKLTPDKPIIISDSPFCEIKAFVDAAFGCRSDGKSHSGCINMIDGKMVMSSSKKQKITSKDSTEAELVALSENIVAFECIHELVKELMKILNNPIIY